ncbi:MAG: HmuY family protein, partial [Flavobacteriaceae bacterium]|nr:HmuY family protein [Flavobacteriaceae bacterium]
MKNIFYISSIGLFLLFASCSEDDSPISVPQPTGAILNPTVGGPAEPNQVWVDLDAESAALKMKETQRDSWDFGFYCGDEFRVIINNSIMMAAGKIESTDIDAVTEADVATLKLQVVVGNFQAENTQYVDDIKGNYLNRTAIDEISAADEDNKVYLVNMGYSVYT